MDGLPAVVLVGVAVEDRRDALVDTLVDALENGAGGGILLSGEAPVRRSFMEGGDDDVCLVVGEIAVEKLFRDPVDGLDGVAEIQRRDPGRGDQRRHVCGDRADESDLHSRALDDLVLLQRSRHLGGALLVDVGAQVAEVARVGHAPAQVVPAPVELVVADGVDVHPGGVEDLERGQIVLHHGDEGRGPDVVARAEQDHLVAGGAGLLDGLEQPCGQLGLGALCRFVVDPTVEVVEAEDGDGVGGCFAGPGSCLGYDRRCRYDGAAQPEGQGREPCDVACGLCVHSSSVVGRNCALGRSLANPLARGRSRGIRVLGRHIATSENSLKKVRDSVGFCALASSHKAMAATW